MNEFAKDTVLSYVHDLYIVSQKYCIISPIVLLYLKGNTILTCDKVFYFQNAIILSPLLKLLNLKNFSMRNFDKSNLMGPPKGNSKSRFHAGFSHRSRPKIG